jgi:gluconokinase
MATGNVPDPPLPHIVVMGVTGCGKTTITNLLADRLGWVTAEADHFHPQANLDKMAAGHPLTDEDRWPWLRRIRDWVTEMDLAGQPTVVSCSALRRAHRDVLREASGRVVFVHLSGSKEVIHDRLVRRSGHFMPPELLNSQLATLEGLGTDEEGVTLDVEAMPSELVTEAIERLGLAAWR